MSEPPKYLCRIRISIISPQGLEMSEDFSIHRSNFMELCKILGQFSELANRIKKEEQV